MPVPVWERIGTKYYFLFKEHIYKVDKVGYSPDDLMLQILDTEDKDQRKKDRLIHKFGSRGSDRTQKRESIPEEARIAVWRRDGGKCSRCGSRNKLEFDHIIPVSLGGSNTARNVELLCEPCNREKSNNIR